jgi:hypothetical protein
MTDWGIYKTQITSVILSSYAVRRSENVTNICKTSLKQHVWAEDEVCKLNKGSFKLNSTLKGIGNRRCHERRSY